MQRNILIPDIVEGVPVASVVEEHVYQTTEENIPVVNARFVIIHKLTPKTRGCREYWDDERENLCTHFFKPLSILIGVMLICVGKLEFYDKSDDYNHSIGIALITVGAILIIIPVIFV